MYMRPHMRLSSSPTHQSISGRCWTRAYFRDGSKAALTAPKSNFRFTPEGGLRSDIAPCPKSADSVAKVFLRHGSQILRGVGAAIEQRCGGPRRHTPNSQESL